MADPAPSPNPLPTTEGVTQGWKDIATAPTNKEICGAYMYGSRWAFHHLWFDEITEMWTDMFSDKCPPVTHWMPLPPPPGQ